MNIKPFPMLALSVVSLAAAASVGYGSRVPQTQYQNPAPQSRHPSAAPQSGHPSAAPQSGYPTVVPVSPSYGHQGNQLSISSSDTTASLVQRFTPSLVKSAVKKGGSYTGQLKQVSKAFIPLARALVTLKGMNDYSYDTHRHLDEVEYTDRVLDTTLNFMKDLEILIGDSPTNFDQRKALESLSQISGAGIEAAHYDAQQRGGYEGQQRVANVETIGGSLDATFDFLGATAVSTGGQSSAPQQYAQYS